MKFLAAKVLLALTLCCSMVFGQSVKMNPSQPKAGETVSFTYTAADGPLADRAAIETVAYLFNGKAPVAIEVTLAKKGNEYSGEFALDGTSRAFFLTFSDADSDAKDDNNEKGYGWMVYQADGNTPVQGAYGSMASAMGNWSRVIGVKRNAEMGLDYMEKELAAFPESEAEFFQTYAQLALQSKDETAIDKAKAKVTAIAEMKKPSEKEFILAISLAQMMRDQEQVEALRAKAVKKYPKGGTAESQALNTFYRARTLEDQLSAYQSYLKKFSASKNAPNNIEQMANRLALAYGEKGDWDQFEIYFAKINDPETQATVYNSLAWGMSGESIEGEGSDLDRASRMSAKSLKLVSAQLENPAEGKPSYYTDKAWKNNLEYTYGMYADTYALILFKQGDPRTALKYQKKACEKGDFSDAEMNERYAVYAEHAIGAEKTMAFLEGIIRKGHASAKSKDQHKRLFLANHTVATAYSKFLESLEADAKAKLKEHISESMIDLPAADFSLTNLKGETVSLADLKGKVVVLDFWATWCGPCKASFPAMQRTVDKYANQEDVVILFVDTWENGEDKAAKAAKFVEKHSYSFNVLMDNENKVVESYEVTGIPTKFVLDKNGHIRFRSSGFNGNDDQLVEELSLMIELSGASVSSDMR